ncbi:MAG: hypothetical protein JO032_20245 [Alphaproteobacteria bacterium]|nr:hypothetical protein [Alphaproteobacteria bacterium]
MTATASEAGISFPLKDLVFAQQLHQSAQQRLPELAGIIRRHGFEKHIAIRLLHTHFPLDTREVLVHRRHGRTTETRPEPAPHDAIPCTVTASCTDSAALDTIEYFAADSSASGRLAVLADRILGCRAFIAEASVALARDGMNTLYGLGLRFYADELDGDDDLILVERNDFAAERSETAPMSRSVLEGAVWTETSWRLVGDQLVAESACITSGLMACEAPPPPPPV